ncbi:MAG: stage V sporulation protein AD, partial [Oscillospiraceae bacterium]|nr:stage V sporulation protein AD [Oscillospiraceae bacterium]
MARRLGQFSLELPSRPAVLDRAALGGKTEGEGPLGAQFDEIFPEAKLGEENWEQAEAHLLQSAIRRALAKAHCAEGEIGLLFGGDLLNQCIATGFALRALGIPLAGLYGACSTFALSAALAALALDGGGFTKVMAAASSHFCAAEKQFRFPLEYGGQAPPSAQRTATAAAALLLGGGATEGSRVRVSCVIFGRVRDLGVSDANEMGAAMAPA